MKIYDVVYNNTYTNETLPFQLTNNGTADLGNSTKLGPINGEYDAFYIEILEPVDAMKLGQETAQSLASKLTLVIFLNFIIFHLK